MRFGSELAGAAWQHVQPGPVLPIRNAERKSGGECCHDQTATPGAGLAPGNLSVNLTGTRTVHRKLLLARLDLPFTTLPGYHICSALLH